MPIDPHFVNRAAAQFPQAGGLPLNAARPGLRGKAAAHAAFLAGEQHLANVTAAEKYSDPDLAPDLTGELREGLIEQLRVRTNAQFSGPLNGLIGIAERAHADAAAAADRSRPKLDLESATQLVRTDQAWNNHVRPMLEAGKGWDQIIPTLDVDGLLAVERFAPGYEARTRNRFEQDEVPEVLAGIKAASERRMLDVVPADVRAALQEAHDTASALQYTRTVAARISDATTRDAAVVSIGLKRAAFETGVASPVDTSSEAEAAYAAALSGESVAA